MYLGTSFDPVTAPVAGSMTSSASWVNLITLLNPYGLRSKSLAAIAIPCSGLADDGMIFLKSRLTFDMSLAII